MGLIARTRSSHILACVAGAAAPAFALGALILLPPGTLTGTMLAVGLMGAGLIGAAATGRLPVGLVLGALTAAALLMVAQVAGAPSAASPPLLVLAVLVAGFSFSARGTLFARSAGERGWWIGAAIVAGEAAMLAVSHARPGALPEWLLALLPAQWASMAIGTALTGTEPRGATFALLALVGTAATTLLVAHLWPRRWPYSIMFSAWLGLSALVWLRPALPFP